MTTKAVIFDMDGVIFNTETLFKKSFHTTGKFFHIKASEKYRQSLCGIKIYDLKKTLKKDFPSIDENALYERLITTLNELYNSRFLKLKDKNFAKHIQNLKKLGYKTALATGNNLEFTQQLFKRVSLNLENLFDFITTGDDVSVGKPDPEIFLKTCNKLELPPENCFVVEDSENGIKSAHSAGCRPIMVIDLIKPTKQTKAICENIFKKLGKAIKYISKN